MVKNNYNTQAIFFGFTCCTGFLALTFLFQFWPGLMPATAATLADLGFAKCFENSPGFLNFACQNAGHPYGSPSTFGLPIQALIAINSSAFHMPLQSSFRISYALLLGIALAGSLKFFYWTSKNYWIALLGAILFLASPIVSLEGGYGPLRIGFALLPTYVLVNLFAIRKFTQEKISTHAVIFWLIALSCTFSFALFCDGYSFVMALLLCGLLWANWIFRTLKLRSFCRAGSGASVALLSVILSITLYKYYIPEAQYSPMQLSFFRGQGIDLYMFLVPSVTNWLAALSGWHHMISGYQVYSDGPSSSLVYFGYSFLACSIVCTWLMFKKNGICERELIALILIVGLIATLLSLGPALKWHDFRAITKGGISFDNYLMPKGAATLELGTGWIYETIPGVNIMRALYRWQLLVRLAMVTAATTLMALLVIRKHHVIVILLGLALLAETIPALTPIIVRGRQSAHMIDQIDMQVVRDVQNNVTPGAKAIFLQLHPNASQNEYLTSYLCAKADLTCYNVGGDKAMELASNAWPAPVFELISGKNIELNVRDVFHLGLADVIIVPFFDLRMQAYAWPPHNFPRAEVLASLQKQFGEYDINVTQWFALIRPKKTHPGTKQYYAPDNFMDGHVATVKGWGPTSVKSHSKEKVYFWVKTPDAPISASVVVGDHLLPTLQKAGDSLAAPIREVADRTILDTPATYPVYLIDRQSHVKQRLGELTVIK